MLINQSVDLYDRKTEQYIVAYLDILGVTTRIKSLEQEMLSMNKLHNLYTHSIDLTRQIAIEGNKDIKFKIFSDNIIIAKKITPETIKDDIYCLLACVGHFQETAASDCVGWLLRGGITIEELFIDDVMVWGKALLRSYELEDKIAIYPRVIIDKKVVALISEEDKSYGFIRYDFDGFAFLNFLHNCYYVGKMLMNGFELMKKEAGDNPSDRILQKLMWHKNFVNSELDRKNEKNDLKYRLFLDM